MVEYYGWLNISVSFNGEDEEEVYNVVQEISNQIELINNENRILILKAINGNFVLNFSGISNHKSSDVEEIFDLIKYIVKIARGTYGIMYYCDEESEKPNYFSVYKIAKGRVDIIVDNILSPRIPNVED